MSIGESEHKKRELKLSIYNGGAEATTLELIIDKFIEKIRTPELFEIVRMIDFINSKKVA